MKRSLYFILPLFAVSSYAGVVGKGDIVAQSNLGKLSLLHTKSGFSVGQGSRVTPVYSYNTQKELRKLKPCQMQKLLKNGPLVITRASDGEYSVRHKVRGLGGGPNLGWFGYCAIKALGYGTIAAAAGTAIAATGGVAGAALGGAASLATPAVAGSGFVAATVGGGGAATAAAAATTGGAIAVSGGIGCIEAAALAVGAFLTALPTP